MFVLRFVWVDSVAVCVCLLVCVVSDFACLLNCLFVLFVLGLRVVFCYVD